MDFQDYDELSKRIDEVIGEVRTESLDLSFGEILNLHENHELVIRPEYQRLFRWSEEQKSRLIESIVVELPIPQIFVVENLDGVLELIDGLQRISSVIQFISPELIDTEPLALIGCDLIPQLNSMTFADLPTRLRLRIKRSSVRTVIIKRQSEAFIRYEMFKRLNTGGSILSPQEIRNVSARMVGEPGIEFYEFLQAMATNNSFQECIATLAEADREKRGDEELVLRFFATKNARDLFRGSISDWLDEYMEMVMLEDVEFDFEEEADHFSAVFDQLSSALGEGAFVRYRGEDPIGGLAPAYFEAVTIGLFEAQNVIENIPESTLRSAVIDTVQGDKFRSFTGPGANSRGKLEGRIACIQSALMERANA